MSKDSSTPQTFKVPESLAGKRIDQVLAHCLPDYSRSRLQQWLKSGFIQVDGRIPKSKEKMQGGENIEDQGNVQH